MKKTDHGFSLIIALIVLSVILLLGFAGYYTWTKQNNNSTDNNQQTNNAQGSGIEPSNDPRMPNPAQEAEEQKNQPMQNYQAVYLSDGQLYFGELTALPNGNFELARIFYLEGGSYKGNGEVAYEENENVSLAVLYKDEYTTKRLILQKEDIYKWENMDNDSQIAQAMQEHNKQP